MDFSYMAAVGKDIIVDTFSAGTVFIRQTLTSVDVRF